MFPGFGPQSEISFRANPSAGTLHASVDDQEERVLVQDRALFQGRTFYPSVFTYGIPYPEVELLRCARVPLGEPKRSSEAPVAASTDSSSCRKRWRVWCGGARKGPPCRPGSGPK